MLQDNFFLEIKYIHIVIVNCKSQLLTNLSIFYVKRDVKSFVITGKLLSYILLLKLTLMIDVCISYCFLAQINKFVIY